MTTAAYPNDTGTTAPDPPPSDCDPDLLDDLACAAQGVAAQAAYNALHAAALATARGRFDEARKLYGASRAAAETLTTEVRKQLTKLLEQLDCLIDDAHTVRGLRDAFHAVAQRLDDCGGVQSGCYCSTDCDFDDLLDGLAAEDVAATTADLERRTAEAEACFADLITEPTALTARATAVQTAVAAIATQISGSPETTDFRRLFVAALVEWRNLSTVWRGFADVNDYVDCLCQVLTCMFRGHAAVAELRRREAVYACHRTAELAQCEHLRANTVDEVLAEFLRDDGYGRPGYGDKGHGGKGHDGKGYGGGGDRDSYPDGGSGGHGGSGSYDGPDEPPGSEGYDGSEAPPGSEGYGGSDEPGGSEGYGESGEPGGSGGYGGSKGEGGPKGEGGSEGYGGTQPPPQEPEPDPYEGPAGGGPGGGSGGTDYGRPYGRGQGDRGQYRRERRGFPGRSGDRPR